MVTSENAPNSAATLGHIEPIVKTIRVRATPERAFEVFTAARWWLPDASVNPTKSPIAAVVLEPKVGGRWYERGVDGSECNWGKVLVWSPPERFVSTWEIAGQSTEVEVRFTPVAPEEIEVRLEHRLLERYGDSAGEMYTEFSEGWSLLLAQYEAAFIVKGNTK